MKADRVRRCEADKYRSSAVDRSMRGGSPEVDMPKERYLQPIETLLVDYTRLIRTALRNLNAYVASICSWMIHAIWAL